MDFNPTRWRIRPVVTAMNFTAGAQTRTVPVNCWRVRVRMIGLPSATFMDGLPLSALMSDASAGVVVPYEFVIGGIFDGHGQPVNVVHDFIFTSGGDAMSIVVIEEQLEAWNR